MASTPQSDNAWATIYERLIAQSPDFTLDHEQVNRALADEEHSQIELFAQAMQVSAMDLLIECIECMSALGQGEFLENAMEHFFHPTDCEVCELLCFFDEYYPQGYDVIEEYRAWRRDEGSEPEIQDHEQDSVDSPMPDVEAWVDEQVQNLGDDVQNSISISVEDEIDVAYRNGPKSATTLKGRARTNIDHQSTKARDFQTLSIPASPTPTSPLSSAESISPPPSPLPLTPPTPKTRSREISKPPPSRVQKLAPSRRHSKAQSPEWQRIDGTVVPLAHGWALTHEAPQKRVINPIDPEKLAKKLKRGEITAEEVLATIAKT